MRHSKSYKEKKSHPVGSKENPLPSKMSKKEIKGIRKISVKMKHSKKDLEHAHKHMKEHMH